MDRSVFSRAAGVVAGCVLMAAAGQAQAAVIVSDTFVGASANLNGHVSPTGGAWTANANAFNLTPTGLSPIGTGGFIGHTDFVPQNGFIYRLSADITVTSGVLAIGFQSSTAVNPIGTPNTSSATAGNTNAPFIYVQPTKADVFITHVSGQAANAIAKPVLTSGSTHNFAFELDTTGANWTLRALLDGVQLPGTAGSATAGGLAGLYTYTTNPTTFNHVFVGTNSGVGRISNFQLITVPEPASVAAMGLMAAGALARRRRH